ncbi:family 78 glycoside hydrolase catalytic domain [Streptomyces sp. FXJ1.172]|uniref:alpha-L-rhamnosidase n=1 Tax=Streptomyces sp. FXJ1.172 TaxID=710705 RepID=UPI0009A01F83|nr:alpha-L-rhamnosidase [Streptomyces sp. FXJ1.172]WEO99558.1 family 78 glycoside hydrolase catalytic domain [Streptomyces sp. FXJ1.172]
MNDGVDGTTGGGIRRRTVLATALGSVPVIAAGGTGGAGAAQAPVPIAGDTGVEGLTVEHRTNPLGVDAAAPRFGWRMRSSVRGRRQSAYRLLVAGTAERLRAGRADVWDSGRVASADSVAVRYGGRALRPSTRYFWTVLVWDENGRAVSGTPVASFETGLLSTDGTTGWDGARWITMAGKKPNSPGAPLLRHEAALRGRVREARLYVSALGVYEAYVNGRRVAVPLDGATGTATEELLTPGWTNYDTTTCYFTYDVTGLLAADRRVTLAAVLGNGWYNGRISEGSVYYSQGGNPLALKAKLLLRYADGSAQALVTVPGSGWKATDTGPHRADDIYDGQTYDARRELPGWAANGYDDSGWADVTEHPYATRFPGAGLVAHPGESARLTPEWDRRPRSVTVCTGVAGQDGSPNGKGHVVVDASRTVTDPDRAATAQVTLTEGDTAVFDLGQNMVGVPRYTLRGPAGAQVTLRFGEMLNDASKGADGPEGSVYRANLRGAKATSTYILKGDRHGETHQDSLTFYGFRYASVTVTGGPVTVTGLTGRVATSALRETGSVATDDDKVNQLISNVHWGQRGNYLWVPTDCPQRDERLGWTGDTQLFSNTGLYNVDAVAFLSHFEDILVDSQKTYGADHAQFTHVAPGNRYNSPEPASGWSDCGVVVPWTVWQMSGDSTVIDRSWAAMATYMDWIHRRTKDSYAGQGAIFGDWLAFQQTSTQLMSDVYYGYSARLMADMAAATGRTTEAHAYQDLFSHIKRAFISKYLSTEGGVITVRSSLGDPPAGTPGGTTKTEDDTQTALLWVLKLGFYDTEAQRRQLVTLLAENIGNDAAYKAAHPDSTRVQYAENTLSVGFLGVNVLAPVLTAEGRADLAYRLLHQNAMPSWLYSVENGATTVWERWNSYSKQDGFGPVAMNSFNHYSYGAIMEWMYESMAGIAKDTASPGFRHFFLRPHLDPTGRITHVSGSHLSPYGQIVSEWRTDHRTLTYRVAVPANSTATLSVPTTDPSTVRDGRTPLAHTQGVQYLGFTDGTAAYRLPSGRYELTASLT